MPLFQIGYRCYEGGRTSRWLRWLPITRAGLTIAWRSKLLRRITLFSFLPFLYFAVVFFLLGRATDPANQGGSSSMLAEVFGPGMAQLLRDNPGELRSAVWSVVFAMFGSQFQLLIGGLVAAVVGPSLISNDIRTKAFLIYFARPISAIDYIAGKAGVLLSMLACVTLVPSVLLYALSILFSPSIDTLLQTLPVALTMTMASVCIIVPVTLLVLTISSLTSQPRAAAATWIGICALGPLTHGSLQATRSLGGSEWTFLLSLPHTLSALVLGFYDVPSQVKALGLSADLSQSLRALDPENSPTKAAVMLGLLSIICIFVLLRRVDAPTRI
jgi:ABC-2 type transport system permease protein